MGSPSNLSWSSSKNLVFRICFLVHSMVCIFGASVSICRFSSVLMRLIYFSFEVVYLFEMACSIACKHILIWLGVCKFKSSSLFWKERRVFDWNLCSLPISTKVMTTWHSEIGNLFMGFAEHKPCSLAYS